jgi:DNA-binding NarL/FixJ family response regulator
MTKANAFVWAAYMAAQKRADRKQVGPNYWSADQTADRILDLAEAGVTAISPHAIDKMARNLRRNLAATERRRKAIEQAHYAPLQETMAPSPEARTHAVLELERLRRDTSEAEWDLLQRVAVGETQAEIAAAYGVTEKTIELRLARLRRRLAA